MPVIESYSFGCMVIDGKQYTRDVIIFPDDTILSPWWRTQGHRLDIPDLEELLAMEPELIITGTGASGLMQPSPALVEMLNRMSIDFTAQPTGEAVKTYASISRTRRTGGCFHLTC